MSGTFNIDQININITDVIPPENFATITKNGMPGNTYSIVEDNEWRAEVEATTQSGVKGVAKPDTPYDPVTNPIPTPWTVGSPNRYEKYDVNEAGTFPNFIKNNDQPVIITSQELELNEVQIWVTNGVAEKVLKAMPQATKVIPEFQDLQFPTTSYVQTEYQGSFYKSAPNVTINSGDIPGISSKWIKMGNDFESLEDFSNSEDITPVLENGGTNMDGGVVGGGKHTGWITLNPKDKLFVKVGFVHDSILSIFKNSANQIIGNFQSDGTEKEIEVPKDAVAVNVSGSEPITVKRKSYVDDLTSGVATLLVDAGFKEEIRTAPILQGFEGVFNGMEKIPIDPTKEVILLTLGYGGTYGQNNWDYFDVNDVLVGSGKLENGEYAINKRIYPPINARKITLKSYGRLQFYINATSETYYNLRYAPKTIKTDVEAQRYYDLGRNRTDLSTRAANNTYGIMLMGQSNATAVGEGTAQSDLATYGLPTSQNVRQYSGSAGGIYPMTIGSSQHWGVEWPLLKKLRDYRPATAFNYLHKALGGTSLVGDWMPEQWHNTALGGQAADMVANWKLLEPLVNMKCVVWIQGEHDAGTAAYYYQKLKDFIAFLRGASGNPNLRFVCMGVHKDSALYYPAVRGAQMQLIGEDPYYYFVNPDDLPMTSGDQIHYNGAMLNLLSQKIFDVIKDF